MASVCLCFYAKIYVLTVKAILKLNLILEILNLNAWLINTHE